MIMPVSNYNTLSNMSIGNNTEFLTVSDSLIVVDNPEAQDILCGKVSGSEAS